jgi:hypothetical protein
LLYTFMVTMIVFFSRYSDFNKTEKSYRWLLILPRPLRRKESMSLCHGKEY